MKATEVKGLENLWSDLYEAGLDLDVEEETDIDINVEAATITLIKAKGEIESPIEDVTILFEGTLTITDPFNIALYAFSKVDEDDAEAIKTEREKLKELLPQYKGIIQDAYDRNY